VERRPLKTRSRGSARAAAAWLARSGIRPNHISVLGVLFAAAAGAAFVALRHVDEPLQAILLVAAAASIQLRLLCNMLDGLLAVEGGLASPVGDLYNDVPDRIADVVILAGAGYAIAWPWGEPLGWVAATAAVLTAYVRVLGGALGARQYFVGPMAKQHRMATLTGACILSLGEVAVGDVEGVILAAALAAVFAGSLFTAGRRLALVARELQPR
jgi:phosphatidylglycerophosphate synthase